MLGKYDMICYDQGLGCVYTRLGNGQWLVNGGNVVETGPAAPPCWWPYGMNICLIWGINIIWYNANIESRNQSRRVQFMDSEMTDLPGSMVWFQFGQYEHHNSDDFSLYMHLVSRFDLELKFDMSLNSDLNLGFAFALLELERQPSGGGALSPTHWCSWQISQLMPTDLISTSPRLGGITL